VTGDGLDAIRVEPVDGRSVVERTETFERGANSSADGSSGRMGVSTGHRPGQETTRTLLEKIAAGDAALKLRRQVIAWNPGATEDQVEDAFQEACARAGRSCRGQAEGEVYTWLRTTTHRCLGRMRERRARERIDDQPIEELESVALSAPGADVAVLEREKLAEVESVARVVLAHLSQRQLDVAALHSLGLRRREIAERLQTSPRVVKRLMEQVLTIGRAELAEMAGHGCEAGHDEVARFAFWLGEWSRCATRSASPRHLRAMRRDVRAARDVAREGRGAAAAAAAAGRGGAHPRRRARRARRHRSRFRRAAAGDRQPGRTPAPRGHRARTLA
jgi:DNA-binding CsgD family transcriptional regulator